jgi:hypothetical protein
MRIAGVWEKRRLEAGATTAGALYTRREFSGLGFDGMVGAEWLSIR